MVCWVISLITDFNPRSPDGERREVATPCCSISYFNPRSPDGERRYDAMYHPAQWRFQSTLPGWGATTMEFRTPLAGLISIHAPRMGSDKSPRRNSDSFYAFQSTLPGWGATYFNMRYRTLDMISIHAPRMGSDPLFRLPQPRCTHFNPRSPDGERHHPYPMAENDIYFNPRSPDGERRHSCNKVRAIYDFNPRSPDGERLWYAQSADC